MRRKGVYWTEPEGSTKCHSYSARAYTAVLKDAPATLNWLEVCSGMPVTIHGRQINQPNNCERKDVGTVVGTWLVGFNEPECVPYWDSISDKGCAPGKPGMRRVQGRLWALPSGDDWARMCASTPAIFNGTYFEHPTSCENKVISGMMGLWDYPDESC
ncbi:hypothetical protein OH77DRAFT_1497514 [Trametes cingulata]|nr:hypothetical protein OH77DRAFT_1497514 [Trametes cingulata]